MIYLLLAIICTSMVSIVIRISEKYVRGNYGMLVVNYAMCTTMAAFYSGVDNLFPKTDGIRFTLGLGICTGIFYLAGLFLVKVNVRKNGVVLATIFQKLGLLVQLLIAIMFFGETPAVIQVIGIVLCLTAIILINFEKEQTEIKFKAGLILILLVSGISDGMSKIYEELGNSSLSSHFLFYTFGVALICSIFLLIGKKEEIGIPEL